MRDYDNNSDSYELSSPDEGKRLAHGMRKLGHTLIAIPIVGNLLGLISPLLTGVAALYESGSSFLEGRFSKAFKQLISGTVDTAVTAASTASLWWLVNAPLGLVSGATLPEYARRMTNWTLDSIDHAFTENKEQTDYARGNRVIGMNPSIGRMRMAGMGWSPSAAQAMAVQSAPGIRSYNGMPQAPNYFTDRVAQERGMDPEQMRRNWMRDADNRQYFQELVAAGTSGPSVTRGA